MKRYAKAIAAWTTAIVVTLQTFAPGSKVGEIVAAIAGAALVTLVPNKGYYRD